MRKSARLKIEGFPEEVQLIADALDIAFPAALRWNGSGTIGVNGTISVYGTVTPLIVAKAVAVKFVG